LLLEAARLVPDDAAILNDLGVAYLAALRIAEAVTCLRRSIACEPNVGESHFNLGLALQHAGDDEGAIIEHRRAVALSAELAAAHGQLADLLWEKGLRQEAVVAYERAYAAAPTTTLGRLSKAKALGAGNRDAEAEEELRECLAHDGSSSEAHVMLGRLLQEAGRFDEAIASFERAVAMDPWQTNAYHGLVSSRRLNDADRPLVTRIVARLDAPDWDRKFAPVVAEQHRVLLHFAAGKALDDLGDYAGAMRHFVAANTIRRRLRPFDRAEIAERVDQIVARFTREFFSRHAALGRDDETPVLVVGMPRSGSTLVERVVSSHPSVHGCGELAFWTERGPIWARAHPRRLARVSDGLRRQYVRALRRGAPDTALRATDKMPFNFFWAGLVHLIFPNARIVHCRRNPLDTCFSIHTTPLTNWGFASVPEDLVWYYRQYLRLVEHWRAVLPPGCLLDVEYEDLVSEPEKAARRLVDFLGLAWDSRCLRPEDNPDAVRTASSWQARQPIYRTSVERWRHYAPWLGALRAVSG